MMGGFLGNKKAVSPVIAIVLLLMMTVAAAGAAYFWITSMQSSVQQSAGSQIEAITKSVSTRVIAQATICKGINEVNLKAYWKMDEGSGDYANDSSKYENDGTLHPGPDGSITTTTGMWTPNSKYGDYALKFDGNDSYVDVGDDPSLDITSQTTWTVWFKTDGTGEINSRVFNKGNKDYGILIQSDGSEAEFYIDKNGGSWWGWINAKYDYRGKWSFAAFVFNNDGGKAHFYQNGEVIASRDVSSDFDVTSNPLVIGSWENLEHSFGGKIDEVRLYDRALSQAQVEYLNDTNKAMGRYVNITVYNAGTEEVPEGAWVANLKKDGTTVDSDSYNASKLPPEERITLDFYFDKMKPGKEYTIELEGTQTSTTVSC